MPVNGIYVLQNVDPAEIAAAPVEVKVVDIYNSDSQLFSASEVAQMGGGAGGGTLLGYFSIGEAEDYRDYYPDLPKNIVGPVDPNWPGNFYVEYWTDEWKQVAQNYIDKMITQGFDGAYFDVVDVAERAWAKQNAPNGDARGEMISLIKDLADYAHAKVPDFKIWVNTSGAEPMANDATFVNAIDGALEEELFYQDNGQPQSAADVNFNLDLLHNITAAGKSVVAIEYVTGAAKVSDVHAKAAAAGIGSYIANPDLELNGVENEGFAGLPPPSEEPNPPVTPPTQPDPEPPVTPPTQPDPDPPVTPPTQPDPEPPVTPPAQPDPEPPVTPPTQPDDPNQNVTSIDRGRGQTYRADGDDTINLASGRATLIFRGEDNVAFIGGSGPMVNATIRDRSDGLTIQVSEPAKLKITGLTDGPMPVIELLNGVGGYASIEDVAAALTSDGRGGTMLDLGGGGSIVFANVAPKDMQGVTFKFD